MLICARDSIWNTPTVSATCIIAYVGTSPPGTVAISSFSPRCRSTRSKALRMQVSMPSARQSTLSRPSVSRSSLSHWMMLRSTMAAFSTGTSADSGASEITKPPTCCDRCRGRPSIIPASPSTLRTSGLPGSKPDSRRRCSIGVSPLPQPKHSASSPIWSWGRPKALATSRTALLPR